MKSTGKRSKLTLEVRLRGSSEEAIEFQDARGYVWQHDSGPPPLLLRSEQLWSRIAADWAHRRDIVREAGATLGEWLFDQRAADYLRNQAKSWSEEENRHRIELRVPAELAEWPWEMVALQGLGVLATHQALIVVRVSDHGKQPQAAHSSQIAVEVVGVKLEKHGSWADLATGKEIESIRAEIEMVENGRRFSVKVDPLGGWSAVVQRYTTQGPPHVFHFAGHGLDQGKGLVFRGEHGGPEEISADRVASLLCRKKGGRGRRTRLAFLNACSTTAPGGGRFQPFGGLAQQLIQHGIPAVVGFQAPVEDNQASELAAAFYEAVARGDSVDCALQEARTKLFDLGGETVSWGFASLTVSGTPEPLFRPSKYKGARRPSATLMDFGHEEQRHRLERFLRRRHPMVVVIHGEDRSGHRHVALRVQHDLERAGNVLWRPVAVLHWFVAGEPLLSRSQLAGGIAKALIIPDTGKQEELEDRIAREIAERCAQDRTVVIDLEEEVTPRDKDQGAALITLIQVLWTALMHRATEYGSILPVFLILPVAYPKPLPGGHRLAKRVQKQILIAEQAIEEIATEARLKGKVRVEVLPKLRPIEQGYVADFLEEVLELDPDDADSMADNIVGAGDNERILQRMARLLADWETS